jgi:hypothetical protein
MSEGISAFKAMALGLGAVMLVAVVAPDIATGQFDAFRLNKGKGKGSGGTTTSPTPTEPAPTEPAPTEPAPTTGAIYPEDTLVPSNFDINSTLMSASLPASAYPDTVGAFRFICGAGQLTNDDPIMYPDQPGKSHLHQFYGNTSASANSTYPSLRSAGDSTCNWMGNGTASNRSAYWMPAMLDGKGNAVRPDYVSIYYKQRPATDPVVSDPTNPKYLGRAVPLPNGLRYIFGWDPTGTNSIKTGGAWFNCQGPSAKPGHYLTLSTALANCPAGNQVGAVIQAPECWDGKRLDSADHRSHVAYASYGTWGYLKCPSTHPYNIPTFTMGAWYSVEREDDTTRWALSSDHMAPGQPAGHTFHADWFGAWDNNIQSVWWSNCINKLLNCSAGNLGNGTQLKGAAQPIYNGIPMWKNPQRLVAVPA